MQYIAGRLWTRPCVAPQVYWSRYLPAQVVHGTCILSAPPAPSRSFVQVFTAWFLEPGNGTKKRGERLKIHRSGTSFSLEMLILVRRSIESLGGSVIEEPLNFFAEREKESGYNEYLAIAQI